MTLRIAIAGISHWHAPRYLEALERHRVTLVGVSDHDTAFAKARGRDLSCPGFADTHDMLAATRPDFAVVLPRHDQARAEIEAVADRRVAALIEKPMGLNAGDAAAAAAAMDRAGVFAASCLPNRHLSFWEAIDTLRGEGKLGRPIHASFRIINGPPQRYRDYGVPWMLDPAISGGGPLRNLGSHGADAAFALAGGDLAVRGALIANRAHGLAIEDFAAATVASADGFEATLEVGYSFAAPEGGDQEWRLAATGAYVVDANGTLTVTTADGATSSARSRRAADCYRMMLDDAIARFTAGRPPVATLGECARAVALLDAIYRAGRAAPP